MEYTVQKLANLAGISTRTLRYYDEIGILKPTRLSSSGYRIYGQTEVDTLQHILFYRELGLSLDNIKDMITSPTFDSVTVLKQHLEQLQSKRKQLDVLIRNVDKTIAATEGRKVMSDQEKFEGFKQTMVDENEKKYGEEIRKNYGDKAIDQSNAKLKGMTPQQYEEVTQLENEVKAKLAEAYIQGDPSSELAQNAADLHKQWLTYYWREYNKEAHAGLAQMYVDDERFRAYYDAVQPGSAEFLRDAILIYTGMSQ